MRLNFLLHSPASILPAALGVLLLTGCEHRATKQSPSTPVVTIAAVERKEIVEQDEFTGRVEPVEAVSVRPRVSGYIQEVRFQSGQMVKKGEVLFVIDPRWHQAEFDRRQAEVEQAKARRDNARREADRTDQLLATRAISVEEADTRKSRHQEAKAALLAAHAAMDAAKLDLDS